VITAIIIVILWPSIKMVRVGTSNIETEKQRNRYTQVGFLRI
jgi:hypothetical protein